MITSTVTAQQPPVPATAHSGRSLSHPALNAVILATAATWTITILILLFIVPRFETTFRDTGLNLSLASRSLFAASRWTCGTSPGQLLPGFLVLCVVGLTVGVTLAAISRHPRTRPLATFVLLALALLGLALLVSTFVGLFEPLLRLISTLQGQRP